MNAVDEISKLPGIGKNTALRLALHLVNKENDDIITETLAKVYAKQEHFEKAILAYQKLSLKYPQKSSYFADQIKVIKKIKK